jgi:thiosulfate dehydrogenase
MKRDLVAFVAGVVFSAGLALSGMTQPSKVLGFLDFFGGWDPSLAFVMVGAIGVSAIAFHRSTRRASPVLGDRFRVPEKGAPIDRRLLAGAAIFGVGWGLAGLCPGPAVVSLASLQTGAIVFVVCMLVGMAIHRALVPPILALVVAACSRDEAPRQTLEAPPKSSGVQVPPHAPAFHVRSLDRDLPSDEAEAERVRLGARIFGETKRNAGAYVGSDISCRNCHLEGGQKEGALPLLGAEAMYPSFQKRSNRMMTIEERIQGCFERSENGTAPPAGSDVLAALVAYMRWLAADEPRGVEAPWRARNRLDESRRVPIAELRVDEGERLYLARCAACHGLDGRGLVTDAGGQDAPVPPALWGPRSFNDGAGVARVYTLAGFIRWAMPLGAGGTVSDVDAQNIAAYIDSKERPSFPRKLDDYPDAGPPVDAVYYVNRYPKNPLRR